QIFKKAFSPAVREVRFLLSQTGPASSGTREFILANYPVIKQHNQDLPRGTPARVFARFVASRVAEVAGLGQK
ncbi:hypothetical protein BKA70DRAFT_1350831, partial [Coprinopsis sp. MPI-PUGE-AT-0042]